MPVSSLNSAIVSPILKLFRRSPASSTASRRYSRHPSRASRRISICQSSFPLHGAHSRVRRAAVAPGRKHAAYKSLAGSREEARVPSPRNQSLTRGRKMRAASPPRRRENCHNGSAFYYPEWLFYRAKHDRGIVSPGITQILFRPRNAGSGFSCLRGTRTKVFAPSEELAIEHFWGSGFIIFY